MVRKNRIIISCAHSVTSPELNLHTGKHQYYFTNSKTGTVYGAKFYLQCYIWHWAVTLYCIYKVLGMLEEKERWIRTWMFSKAMTALYSLPVLTHNPSLDGIVNLDSILSHYYSNCLHNYTWHQIIKMINQRNIPCQRQIECECKLN